MKSPRVCPIRPAVIRGARACCDRVTGRVVGEIQAKAEAENKEKGRRPMGVEAILAQDPHSTANLRSLTVARPHLALWLAPRLLLVWLFGSLPGCFSGSQVASWAPRLLRVLVRPTSGNFYSRFGSLPGCFLGSHRLLLGLPQVASWAPRLLRVLVRPTSGNFYS